MVMASAINDFNTEKKYNKPAKFRYVRKLVVDDLKGHIVLLKIIPGEVINILSIPLFIIEIQINKSRAYEYFEED